LKDFPVLQLRLRMPFDGTDHPRSLISKVRKYSKVLDVRNSLTYIPDFIAATQALIAKRKTGIYNMVNPGAISPYEMMVRYKNIVDPSHVFTRISQDDLLTVTKTGRSNCVLSTATIETEGIGFRPLDEAVEEAMQSLKALRR
jgi:dTDP-4-dehydrorhamnose reductase